LAITASSPPRRTTPGRAGAHLAGNSAGRIDAVAFVESIPFSETRGYVKNVLAYDAYYATLSWAESALLSDAEWQRRY
jgi:soluble lytic murein transglycosylase